MDEAPSPGFSRVLQSERRRRGRGRVACAAMVVFFILLLIVGHASRWFAQIDPTFDVFSHFRLQVMLGIGAFGIGLLIPRARVLTGIVILIVGLLIIGLYPQVHSEAQRVVAEAPAGTRALKVMSFNMSLLNRRPDLVLAEIERVNPDVVALIEFSPDQRDLLVDLQMAYPYSVNCFGRQGCYFALFSRYAFSTDVVRTNWKTPRLISARFGQELGNLTLLGVHVLRFPHSYYQMVQMRALAAALAPINGPKIVMGDFNATAFSNALQSFEALSGLERHSGLPSWPSTMRLPQIGIDHVFASRDIRALSSARIGRYAGSDHYSVDVTLAVPVR